MSEPVWLDLKLIAAIQSEQIAVFGGASGRRDETLLHSALDRPRNKWSNGEEDLVVLAAAYGFGLARNHSFVEGNKRTAFLSIIMFLGLNGTTFDALDTDATVVMEALASGHLSESELAAWIARNSPA